MASSLHFLLFSFLFISLSTTAQTSLVPLILPIFKDTSTLQYLTLVHQGTPSLPTTLLVDLGGSSLWMDCQSSSSSYQPVGCRSIQCSTANANTCQTSFTTPSQQKTTACGLSAKNTITGMTMTAELGEDVFTIPSMTTVDNFLFSCASTFLSQGLPTDVKGMVGLGRNRISLPSQLARALDFDRKFSICLPSSTNSKGVIFFNTAPYSRVTTNNLARVSKSLMYTPLINNPQEDLSDEYYIGVKSIRINHEELSLNTSLLSINDGVGGTRLSTVVPFTTLETSIYKAFTKAFTEAATSIFHMTRVASVAPFEVCFSSEDKRAVPTIDLVLQSNMVKWRIYGANSMVQITDKVMCLGFLDGGLNAKSSIVLGGYQLEDNLIEFDLASSRMGFTSLLERQIQCSELNFDEESSRSS